MTSTLYGTAVAAKKKEHRDRFDLRIEPSLLARTDAQAERFGTNISAYIRQAITEKLERDEATVPPKPKKS